MAIPGFQTFLLPILQFTRDQKEHSSRETIEALARQMEISQEDRRALLPSGRQPVFDNRVSWCISYLKHALLLESTRKGFFRITERGLQVLQQAPQHIDIRFLRQFPEFLQFNKGNGTRQRAENETDPAEIVTQQTPEETLEYGYQRLRQELSEEILAKVKSCSPAFFERLVVELLVKMGYGGTRKDAGEAVGQSGDGGIDGIIKEDRLGLDIIYIQAKRWEGTVGRPEIQKFVGAIHGQRARKGVFITTSDFTKDAREYVSNIESKIILIDGLLLANLMIDHDVGVSTVATYALKRTDSDYFSEA